MVVVGRLEALWLSVARSSLDRLGWVPTAGLVIHRFEWVFDMWDGVGYGHFMIFRSDDSAGLEPSGSSVPVSPSQADPGVSPGSSMPVSDEGGGAASGAVPDWSGDDFREGVSGGSGAGGSGGWVDPEALAGVLSSAVEDLVVGEVWRWSLEELREVLLMVHEVEARLAALRGRVLVEAGARGLASEAGASDLAGWLAARLLVPRFEANRMVNLARELFESPYLVTGEALAGARITAGHAHVIVEAMEALPPEVSAQERVEVEHFLVEQGMLMDRQQLKKAALVLLEQLTQVDRSPGGADPHEDGRTGEHSRGDGKAKGKAGAGESQTGGGAADGPAGESGGSGRDGESDQNGGSGQAGQSGGSGGAARRARRDPRAARTLSFFDTAGGTTLIRGELDAEGAALLRAAVDALSAPVPAKDGMRDPRGASRRRADALVEFVRRGLSANVGPSAGGTRPHLQVTIGWETLFGGGNVPAMTQWGGPLPREVVERLGCDAAVTRIVLDPEGVPLDVGRTKRVVPPKIRTALVKRDGGCTFPHCDRPASWCEAHHVIGWEVGGVTALDNLTLLCDQHHDRVHREHWKIVIDGDRRPSFVPPAFIDPLRRPRRNPNCQPLPDLFGGLKL